MGFDTNNSRPKPRQAGWGVIGTGKAQRVGSKCDLCDDYMEGGEETNIHVVNGVPRRRHTLCYKKWKESNG